MRVRLRAISLIDLVVTGAVVGLLIAVAVPTSARMRELSKRLVCSTNLAGIGAAEIIYAQSNNGSWSVPAFASGAVDEDGIDYLLDGPPTGWPTDLGEVGQGREFQTTSPTPQYPQHQGSTAMSVTRAYWMLVRSGDVTVRQFICPSSSDVEDDTENLELYYDFSRIRNISYGYQVPFGPPDTRARENMDNRQGVGADKGPYYNKGSTNLTREMDFAGPNRSPVTLADAPLYWRRFNSNNHGGTGNGEGQNMLHVDGHVGFMRIPAVGVDDDNLYTLIVGYEWKEATPPGRNRIYGDSPHYAGPRTPYPGQDAFGVGPGKHSSTDSLIFP